VPDLDLAKLAVEISSFALIAWLMMQTFSKTLPTLSEQFRQDLQREREASERGLDQVAQALERLSVILIYHDATVRGKNPETLGSTEELLRLLRGRSKGGAP
jgi:hypothetical protein